MIEIVSIGDEILQGATLNTNAHFIAGALYSAGYEAALMSTIPDHREGLIQGLKTALQRSDIVIVTGGLGPTLDDTTKAIVTEMMSDRLISSDHVLQDLKKRFGEKKLDLENQAMVPSKAKVMLNTIGTAPGLIFEEEGLFLLPGVPREMEAMWQKSAFPFILQRLNGQAKILHRKIALALLSEQAIDPIFRKSKEKHPHLGFGIYPSYGVLSARVSGENEDELEAVITEIAQTFPDHVMPCAKPEEALHQYLTEKKKSLSVAESCTGGALAARITALPGASNYFLGGIVSYSNAAKEKCLEVQNLEKFGAVSEQTAIAMCEGLFKKFDSDYAISVTGIAGPDGGTTEKPVGTVFAAIGKKGEKPFVGRIPRLTSAWPRTSIIKSTTTYVLAALWRYLAHGVKPFHHP